MEQSWGNVEEVLKDFALIPMNTGFGKYSNYSSINYLYIKDL